MANFIIWHISDLHIKNGAHDNILFAIDQLILQIKKETVTSQLLVIAGDIFDKKTEVSVRDQDCFNQIIDKLKFIKILMIPGHHDFATGNNLNLLKTNLHHYQESNIFLFSESGVYKIPEYSNISFYVKSPFKTGASDSIRPIKCENNFNICILHDIPGDIKIDEHSNTLQNNITVQYLDQFDIVLCGGLHRKHVMGSKNQIAYCGALVPTYKKIDVNTLNTYTGALKWIIDPSTKIFVIQEPYFKLKRIYLILKIVNDVPEILSDDSKFVEITGVDIHCFDSHTEHIEKFKWQIRDKYKCNVKIIIKSEIKTQSATTSHYQFNVSIPENIFPLHQKSIEAHTPARKINSRWVITYLEWTNLFIYQGHNYINFESLVGINSITGPNRIGKSAIIDILCFALFGEISRDINNVDIINNEHKNAMVRCCFTLLYNNEKYEIIKKMSKASNKLKYDDYRCYKYVNGEKKQLNASGIKEFHKKISDIIGTYDEIEHINITTQAGNKNILDSRQERYKIMHRYFGLHIIDKISADIAAQKTNIDNKLKKIDEINRTIKHDYNNVQSIINSSNLSAYFIRSESDICDNLIQKNLEIAQNLLNDYKTIIDNLEAEKDKLLSIKYNISLDDYLLAKKDITLNITESQYLNNQQLIPKLPKAERERLINENQRYRLILDNQKIVQQYENALQSTERIQVIKSEITSKNQIITYLYLITTNLNTLLDHYKEQKEAIEQGAQLRHNKAEFEQYLTILKNLPYEIIQARLPKLTSDINNILHNITDFEIEFIVTRESIEKDIRIDINIKDRQKTMSAFSTSGSQKFIIDLAFRFHLANQSNTPKFLIIDEGFGSMDESHLENVMEFLKSINNTNIFDWILIISHVKEMHSIYNQDIIIKNDGFSNVKFGEQLIKETSQIDNQMNDLRIFETNDEGKFRCILCRLNTFRDESATRKHINTKDHIKYIKQKFPCDF